jgi:hypothetical protein
MADFSSRRLEHQRYKTKKDNAMARLGDIRDCFPNTLSVGSTAAITGAVTLASTLGVDTINEYTSATGVTVDGVLIKDNTLTAHKEPISEAATTVLTAADSGKVFFVDGATSAADYTLPAPAAGLNFKWVWVANCNNAITVTTADTTDTTGDMFYGGLLLIPATDNLNYIEYAGSDVSKLTFDDNLANSAGGVGSWVEIRCVEDAVWCVTGILNSTTDSDTDGSAIGSDVD